MSANRNLKLVESEPFNAQQAVADCRAKREHSEKEREQTAIILTHIGKAARLCYECRRRNKDAGDEAGERYFDDFAYKLNDLYIDLIRKFPGLMEVK